MEYPVVDPVATGRNIRRLRVLKRLKVEDVARFMGFESVQAVYKWQRGESLPTVDNLVALSVLLGTAMDDIIITREEAGEMPASVLYFLLAAGLGMQLKLEFVPAGKKNGRTTA